ncbi:MAG: UbiD family decarboxylase [Lachnospiraceae bacterium]
MIDQYDTGIDSLRSAIEFLEKIPGQIIRTDVEVDPKAELSGVYRYVGAGGTVMRPTTIDGPAMIFNNVKGHQDARVVIGMMASRERVARMFGCSKEDLGHLVMECAAHPIQPVVKGRKVRPQADCESMEINNNHADGESSVSKADSFPPCQEVIHLAADPGFDLNKFIPAPTNTPDDAGPYITLGMCYATHPDTGLSDVTIHRMCIQSRDELSIFLQPGSRHIGAMAERATELGQPLPISVSIGVDPAISVASCFEPPTTPLGFNELSIAGALRGKPVELTPCVSIHENAIANAEYAIEGEILPGSNHVIEDQNSHTGYAMPEFPGYNGHASHECWLLKVKAVTHRKNPIMQTCIGPSEEHVNMAGIPTEASILGMLEKALPGKVANCYSHRAGGGKYMAILQCRKTVHTDEGKQRQAALLAFSAFPELKHVILVDDDVDIFDSNDVLWAMNTRFQGDRDIITIPGVRCHPLDPSSSPEYSNSIRDIGISCKTIFDCTVPFDMKDKFKRAQFMEVDPEKWTRK